MTRLTPRRMLMLALSLPIVAVLLDFLVLFAAAFAEQDGVPAKNADVPVVYRGARIHTASGPVIERGVLVVLKGKILDVGPEDTVRIPAGAVVRDVAGKVIIPGLVDTHSHIGIFGRPATGASADGNEMTGPVQPGLRAIDAINPHDPGIRMALAGGVTTANIMPGSGNAIGGQTLYVKLHGAFVEAMRILTGQVLGGIKFANGENPKGAYGGKNQAPVTRMKIAALQREQLAKAQAYKRQWDNYRKAKADGKGSDAPDRDINLDPLVEVLERKRTVHFHCHRADDIMTAVRLSEEFGFELVLAALHRGLPHRRGIGEARHLGVADADRQPRRQARGDGAARRERRDPGARRASRSRSTPTTSSPNRGSSCAPAPSPCAAACRRTSPSRR